METGEALKNNSASGSRFREAIDFLGMSQKDFATSIGTTSQRLMNWLTVGTKPSSEITLNLVKVHPSVNWFYVIFGEGHGKLSDGMNFLHGGVFFENENLKNEILKLKTLINSKESIIQYLEAKMVEAKIID